MPLQKKTAFPPKKPRLSILAALALLAAGGARAQAPRKPAFHAIHYEVDATLNPADQTLSARAKVDLIADEASSTVQFELHPNLKVTSLLAAGRPVNYEHEEDSPLKLKVTLPEPAATGHTITLTLEYSGPLANEENSPSKGVRLAYIGQDGAYLLLPARWFPLTNFPANRYTGVFNIIVPENFAVVGTGTASAPTPVTPRPSPRAAAEKPSPAAAPTAPRLLYKFVVDRPEPAGTFVAGNLRLVPVSAEGLQILVYALPSSMNAATAHGQALAQIVNYFSAEFGPLPRPGITIAEMPAGTIPGYAAPGLLLVSPRQWAARVNERLLAQLAAGQWWNDQVLPASNADVWLSDGLSRYSEALYEEHVGSKAALHRVLEDCAVGALMYEDAAPIAQAGRLEPFTDDYRSVIVNKGAMVFHMLRTALGDPAFESLLREYDTKFAGKTASLDDFEKLAQTKVSAANTSGGPPLNLVAFFTQWLNSTGVPEFHLDYIIYRTQKGFKVVGKVNQDLETFRMPVEVRVDTEGNPEYKTINVVGKSSEFSIETFGRPKPNGITLDPNNNLLKSSPKLRVRALIARGEELAQLGQFFDAVRQYQRALDVQRNNSLGLFRMGEAFFYQKNWEAAANAFRDATEGDLDPSYKWVEVWSHIYLGKIFDVTGQRERALNEYQKAKQTNDDTGGAQAEADRYLHQPYSAEGQSRPASN